MALFINCAKGCPTQRAPDGWDSPRFLEFVWLEAGSGKVALSRPAHPRVTQAVGQPLRYKEGIMEIWFTATEKFDKYHSGWSNYIQWSQLHQLTEVVSLDSTLCPSIFNELSEEDWQHNVHVHHRTNYFLDLDYLIRRVQGEVVSANILAVVFKPDSDTAKTFINNKFIFCGYDLIEEGSGISALVNCGGFEMAFNNTDISQNGLLTNYVFAKSVQERLQKNYPNESHADCDLWALWRLIES